MPPRASMWLAACLLGGCSRIVHPDYHPEATYHVVQNVTYAHHVVQIGAGDTGGPRPTSNGSACRQGSAPACWADCFHEGAARACELLSLMFRTGDGVVPDAKVAAQLHARACALGDCAEQDDENRPADTVRTPGAVVIYGDLNGNVVIGR